MQIIIARFQEEISWIEKLSKDNPNFFIRLYNKGDLLEKKAGIYVQNLPNIGREGDTFLRHIIDNYEYSFEYNVFLQANPFYHDSVVLDKLNGPRELLQPLGSILVSDAYGGPHHPELPVKEAYNRIFGKNKEEFEFSAGSQYIVHRDLIKSKSHDFWKRLYDIYLSTESAPWVFERLWMEIYKFKEI